MYKSIGLSSLLIYSNLFGQYHSQYKQDVFLHEKIFRGKQNGFFIEIGAYDGIKYSNTKFFEDSLGWTGICIEPAPDIFESLKKNRENCICINAAISDIIGYAEFLKIKSNVFFVEMLSGLLGAYDPKHLARVYREVEEFGGNIEIIQVPCLRLDSILQTHNITHIDYLSIDTEGKEIEILKSIDFDRISISVIEVENNYHSPEFRKFLIEKGFVLVDEEYDEIYVKNTETEILNRLFTENYKSKIKGQVKNRPALSTTSITYSAENIDNIPKVVPTAEIFYKDGISYQLMDDRIKTKKEDYSIKTLSEIAKEILKLSKINQSSSEEKMWQAWSIDFDKALIGMIL